ncbi:hypothetical protein JCM10296v2_002783 [Rhodotorula toruloides]
MADEIVIRTSDSPAKELHASRAVLGAHSTVFKDLFSIPKTLNEAFVEVAESEAQITPFLSILTGNFAEPLSLTDEEWVDVARLADKYNARCATVLSEGMLRMSLPDPRQATLTPLMRRNVLRDGTKEVLALILASYTRNAALTKDAAFKFFDIWYYGEEFDAYDGTSFPAILEMRLFGYSNPGSFKTWGNNECSRVVAKAACYDGIHAAMRKTEALDYYTPYLDDVKSQIAKSRLCEVHREGLLDDIATFEQKYRE